MTLLWITGTIQWLPLSSSRSVAWGFTSLRQNSKYWNKERYTKKKWHRHSLRGKESMWKRLNDKWVVHLATMQGCWQSPIGLPKLPPSMLHSRPFLHFPLFPSYLQLHPSPAAVLPFTLQLVKILSLPLSPSWKQVGEKGWMDSTALLHKNLNQATESGYSACFTPLTLSSFSLSLWVWRHSVLASCPLLPLHLLPRLEANWTYKRLSNGWWGY